MYVLSLAMPFLRLKSSHTHTLNSQLAPRITQWGKTLSHTESVGQTFRKLFMTRCFFCCAQHSLVFVAKANERTTTNSSVAATEQNGISCASSMSINFRLIFIYLCEWKAKLKKQNDYGQFSIRQSSDYVCFHKDTSCFSHALHITRRTKFKINLFQQLVAHTQYHLIASTVRRATPSSRVVDWSQWRHREFRPTAWMHFEISHSKLIKSQASAHVCVSVCNGKWIHATDDDKNGKSIRIWHLRLGVNWLCSLCSGRSCSVTKIFRTGIIENVLWVCPRTVLTAMGRVHIVHFAPARNRNQRT